MYALVDPPVMLHPCGIPYKPQEVSVHSVSWGLGSGTSLSVWKVLSACGPATKMLVHSPVPQVWVTRIDLRP